LYEHSAESGYTKAASYLALVYTDGLWGMKDSKQALHYASLAASLGDAAAAHTLGRAFEKGEGAPADPALALAWYEAAAAKNDPFANLKLAMAYSFGELGVKPDKNKAEFYFGRVKSWSGPGK
jgi:TPR repeat protein